MSNKEKNIEENEILNENAAENAAAQQEEGHI